MSERMTTTYPPAEVRQRAELAGYRALFDAVPAGLRAAVRRRQPRGRRRPLHGVAAQDGSPWLNHVVGLGVTEPVTDADLDRVAAFYAGLGTSYSIAVAPSAAGDLAPGCCPRLAPRAARG